jgi:Zn-dependent protease with chaperone function
VTRLAVLAFGWAAFMGAPWVLARLETAPPRWRVRLAFLAVLGMGASTVSLLAVLLFPEVLAVSRVSAIWEVCSRAIHELLDRPLLRIPSLAAGAGLALVLGRIVWALVAGAVATARARLRAGNPRWRLARGEPVFEAPLDSPTAYSLGTYRRQVVVTSGLLEALDEQEVQAVLFHEEGHLRARHHGKLMIARAIRSALGFLPPVRAALGALEQAMEEAADEHAADRLGDPATVGSALSKVALSSMGSPLGAVALAAGLNVPGRVRRLLEPPAVPGWMPWACLAFAGILLASLALAQAMAGLAILAATHHVVGLGTAALCPLARSVGAAGVHAVA